MAPDRNVDSTDLIDVSDVEPRFEDRLPSFDDDEGEALPMPGISAPQDSSGPVIASLKDRFAAFMIDAACLYVLYWFVVLAYRTIAVGQAAGPIPVAGNAGLTLHGIYLLLALLWFVLPELAFGGSFGKLLCHLSVRKSDGTDVSFLALIIRNILKPVDILLFPVLLSGMLMEWSTWHQRLGDVVARTIVLKRLSSPPRQYALSLDMLASANGRAVAFVIDATIFIVFMVGWALLLTPEQPVASLLLTVTAPIAAFALVVIPEWATKSSPGKWIAGYVVCIEDGTVADLSSAIVRTIWRIVDTNPIGYLTCLISLRHQRPGDAAAGTVVIKAPRGWKGAVGLLAVALAAFFLLSAGLQNRASFLHPDFEVNFLPSIEIGGLGKRSAKMPANLATKNFQFAAGDAASPRKPAIFQPGETVYLVFEVEGFKLDDKRAWLQEDLSVRYPDDTVGLKLENINDFNDTVTREGPIRFENNIAIPESAQAGRYTVTLTIRDKLAKQELKEQRFFYVTPADGGGGSTPPEGGTPTPPKGAPNEPPPAPPTQPPEKPIENDLPGTPDAGT